jgi:hypothetical protein
LWARVALTTTHNLGVRDKKAIKASIGINFATRKARSVCLIEFILRAHLTALTPALSQGTLGTDPQSNPVQPQRARAVVITLSCRRRLLLPTRKLISRSAMAKVALSLSLSPSDPYFLSRAKLKLKSDCFSSGRRPRQEDGRTQEGRGHPTADRGRHAGRVGQVARQRGINWC